MPKLSMTVPISRSLETLPIAELPAFTVLTGLNGCGKTHFLWAIRDGAISVEGVHSSIYRDWSSMTIRSRSVDAGNLRGQFVRVAGLFEKRRAAAAQQLIQKLSRMPSTSGMPLRAIYREACDPGSAIFSASDQREIVREFDLSNDEVFNTSSSPHQIGKISVLRGRLKLPAVLIPSYAFEAHLPITADQGYDDLTGNISALFATYLARKDQNLEDEWRAKRDPTRPFLTPEEFDALNGPPPWDALNSVFETAGLPYRVTQPEFPFGAFEAQLIHSSTGTTVSFENISAGERILASLVFALYRTDDDTAPTGVPELLLLDEIEAPLHSSMIGVALRVIEKEFVERHRRQVILATHSATTIAMAPEGALHVMDGATRLITRSSRDAALRLATSGVPYLSVSREHRRQVFVESEHDAAAYEILEEILRPRLGDAISLNFIAAGHSQDGGCAQVMRIVEALMEMGNTSVFGIVDWDGKNVPTDRVIVLGRGGGYAIEHYLLDPIILAATMNHIGRMHRAGVGFDEAEIYTAVNQFDNTRLQRIADVVLDRLGIDRTGPLQERAYVNGRAIQLPTSFLSMQRHGLDQIVVATFPCLRRYKRPTLASLEVLRDISGFIPADLHAALLAAQR